MHTPRKGIRDNSKIHYHPRRNERKDISRVASPSARNVHIKDNTDRSSGVHINDFNSLRLVCHVVVSEGQPEGASSAQIEGHRGELPEPLI
ncbi:hypothetical protein RHEph01_gp055 [Rhizobium phage RHEph01]|uniref:Uncharacterized protein n=1 Tax=Rhizobium phage RHEph01 TaxID=1220601 RepID=L7TKE1_9CAUD|nr:hypothetical protein HOQ88_gp39 [Rhizobium phage RHEph01]AGC35565.1 hypothetical protein RHEph01_gp055 [Rhizobium phage RHEph01]